MKNALIGAAVVIVIAIAGASVYLLQNINSIVKDLIQQIGTDVTKTEVRVANVDIRLTEGQGSISGLTIANPEGFSQDNLFAMDNITLAIDTSSLTEAVYVIRTITIDGARVLAEHKGTGTNVQTLMEGMESTESQPDTTEGSSADSLFAVELISFTNGSMKLRSDILGEHERSLPNFTMTDLGTREQGMTAEELGAEVARSVVLQVQQAVKNMISDLATEGAVDKIKEKASEGLNKLKGLFSGGDKDEDDGQ